MNLFENIYYDLLIEGKSPEEILQILKYKFKNVPEVVIDSLFKIDPTKKKSYTQWVLMHWENEKHVIDGALQNGMFKKLFGYLQRHQDAQLSKYNTVEDALYLVSNIDLLEKDSDNEAANDFDIVYRSPEWAIAVPNTYEASHKLGENTDWCTAGYKYANGRMYYDRYLNDYGGKYFINFDFRSSEHLNGVEYPFKRYQFHFESKQFMNAHDNPISLDEIDAPDGVIKFYQEEGYDTSNMVNDEERAERYDEARWDRSVNISQSLAIMPEYDENMDADIPEDVTYYVYDTDRDTVDPIDYTPVSKQALYIDETNGFYIFNKNVKGYGDLVTEEPVNLENYDGTNDNAEPLIVTDGGSNGWEVFGNVYYYTIMEVYGVNTLFFVGEENTYNKDNSSYINLINKNMSESIKLPFEINNISSEGINRIFLNDEVGTLWNSSHSDFIFEIVYHNGYHSLINVTSHDGLTYLVHCDKPANDGDYFVEEENEEGDMIILGTLRNYYGVETEDFNDKNTTTIKGFKQDVMFNNVVEVVMNDGKLNLYNTETKQVILPQNFKVIKANPAGIVCARELGVVIAGNNEFAVYSLTTGERLTAEYPLVDCGSNKFYGWIGAQDANKNFYIFSQDLKETYGPFASLNSNWGSSKMFVYVLNNGQKEGRILNYKTGKFEYENINHLSTLSSLSDLYFEKTQVAVGEYNGDIIMFNFEDGNIIDSNLQPGQKVQRLSSYDYGDALYGVKHTNGKQNIVSIKQEKDLLPFDVDEVYGNYSSYAMRLPYTCVRNNENTYYIFNTETKEFLPTNDGITVGKETGVFEFKVDEAYCRFVIHDSAETPRYEVLWNYNTGEVNVAYRENGEYKLQKLQACSPEVQQRVMQVLHPQKAQFVSQYTEMIRRMKNLIR